MLRKTASTAVPIHDLIAGRWSPRAFDADAMLTDDELTALFEAARWSPSCFNDQPWRYLVWDRHAAPDDWARALACLGESNRRWAARAPLLMLSVASGRFAHNGSPNRFAQYDTGAATLALALQAQALGLVAHQMGGFDAERARQEFAIPEDFAPQAMIAIGRPAAPDTLEPDLRDREQAVRQRRPLSELIHTGRWGGRD